MNASNPVGHADPAIPSNGWKGVSREKAFFGGAVPNGSTSFKQHYGVGSLASLRAIVQQITTAQPVRGSRGRQSPGVGSEGTLVDDAAKRPSAAESAGVPGVLSSAVCASGAFHQRGDRQSRLVVLKRLERTGHVPAEFLDRLEYVEWSGEHKDLNFVPDASPGESVAGRRRPWLDTPRPTGTVDPDRPLGRPRPRQRTGPRADSVGVTVGRQRVAN